MGLTEGVGGKAVRTSEVVRAAAVEIVQVPSSPPRRRGGRRLVHSLELGILCAAGGLAGPSVFLGGLVY